MTATALLELLESELRQSAPPPVELLAAQLAARARGGTVAVLYYGSTLRSESLDGVLDFYVILDHVGDWPQTRCATLANRLMPPNVGYVEGEFAGQSLRAKYAVISLAQFHQRMGISTLDTTLWARFCQPSLCVWARSEADRQIVTESLADAAATAAHWAAALGPPSGAPSVYWSTLFDNTYRAELRVEKSGRAADIVARHSDRYNALLTLAWQHARLDYQILADGLLHPVLTVATRASLRRRWSLRARLGKPLNILRLLKSAFTFAGALDYAAWKIERHRGVRIHIAPWQRRFPLLAAPSIYWQLRRRGIFP